VILVDYIPILVTAKGILNKKRAEPDKGTKKSRMFLNGLF